MYVVVGYHDPFLMAVPKRLLSEFGIHHRLESCEDFVFDLVFDGRRMGGGHTRFTSTRGAATPMSGYYREQKDEEEEQEQLEDVREHVSMPGSITRGRVMNRYGN